MLYEVQIGMNKKVLEAFNGKTVLVTGGVGAIGSNLVKTLSSLETKKIIIIDALSLSYEWNIPASSKVAFIKNDIFDDEKLRWVFREKPQIVYRWLDILLARAKEVVGNFRLREHYEND